MQDVPAATARISVICPVFNTPAAFLREAAASVLSDATGQVHELLLADDASDAPETLAMLDALGRHPRVRVLRTARNGGPAAARNRALAQAQGDWVAFTDADDVWLPDHLAPLRQALAHAPDAGWVCGNHAILHADGTHTPETSLGDVLPGQRRGALFRFQRPALTRTLASNYWLHLGGCTVRTDLARAVGFAAGCTYSEDWLFFLRLSTRTDLLYDPTPGYLLRRQHESLTTSDRRLTGLRLTAKRAALRDPALRAVRRELRWALHRTYQGLAANNLLAGNMVRALGYAARAYAMDPRAAGEAMAFARACAAGRPDRRAALRRYTATELAAG